MALTLIVFFIYVNNIYEIVVLHISVFRSIIGRVLFAENAKEEHDDSGLDIF